MHILKLKRRKVGYYKTIEVVGWPRDDQEEVCDLEEDSGTFWLSFTGIDSVPPFQRNDVCSRVISVIMLLTSDTHSR